MQPIGDLPILGKTLNMDLNMIKNALTLGLLMGVGIFTSCNSDDEVQCPEDFSGTLTAEETQLLGSWRLSAIVADTEIDMTDDGEDNPDTDFFVQYEDCQKDARYTFLPDRTYSFEQGQTAEDCGQYAVTLEGTWRLASDQLSLVSGCTLQNNDIEVAGDGSEFSFTGDFSVRDVTGQVHPAKITFTYSFEL